jgi:hypothetical protein
MGTTKRRDELVLMEFRQIDPEHQEQVGDANRESGDGSQF